MARPTKLCPELQAKIVAAVKAGNYIETAAAYAGISKNTLYTWLRKGANADSRQSPYRRFHDALGEALAVAEVLDVATIRAASKKQWQAAAWRLERKYPERWGRKQVMQIKESDEAIESAEVDLSSYSPEELEKLEALLEKQQVGPTPAKEPGDVIH